MYTAQSQHASFALQLATLTLACLGAWAEETPRPPAPTNAQPSPVAEEIKVTGKAANEGDIRRNQPASKIIVGRDELDKYGDSTVAEVLKRLPGVSVGGGPGRGGGIRMRGMSEGYTQILINGEPAARGFSFDSLSPDAIERIEVMRAPTAEHSARAIAGTINIVLREDYKAKQPSQLRMAASEEDGRLQGRLDVQWGAQVDALNYNIGGGYNRNSRSNDNSGSRQGTDGRTGLAYDEVTASQSSGSGYHLNFSPRLTWRIEPGNTVSLQTFLMRNQSSSDSLSTITRLSGPAADYARAESQGESESTMLRGFGNWKRNLSEGAKLDVRFGFNSSTSDSENQRQEFLADGSRKEIRLDDSEIQEAGFSTGGKWSRPLGEDHSMAMGWDLEQSRREEHRVKLVNGLPEVADAGDLVVAHVRKLAAFAQDEWNLGPQWSAYAGLRWEGIRTESEDALGTTSSNSSVWSPMLHAVYRIPGSSKNQLRASLTRSYKAPNTRDLITRPVLSDEENSRSDPDRAGNPNLKPELAWGLDLAYEHYFIQGGLVSASLFGRQIEGLIRRETQFEAANNGRWVSRPRNVGEATSYGIELEAKLRLAEIMDDAPPIDLRANYSRYWSRVDNIPGPDNRLDEQVPQLFNLGLDYRFKAMPLTLGASLNLVPAYTNRTDVDEWRDVDAKRQVDIYAQWRFSPAVQLRLAGNNLLHQDYETRSRQTGTGAVQSRSITPTYTQWTMMLELKF